MNTIIKVHHLVDNKNEIIKIEIDDQLSFGDVKKEISHVMGNDIFVVPSKRNFTKVPSTIGEYCSLSNDADFHFSIIHLLPSFNDNDNYFSEDDIITLLPTLDNYLKIQLKVDLKPTSEDPTNYVVAYFTDQKGTEKIIKSLCAILPNKEKDSLTVRLQDGLMTMLGRSLFDTTTTEALEGNTVNSQQMGPYPSIKGGASGVPIFKTLDGSFMFAVVQNRLRDNRTREKQDAFPVTYEVSGGYMDAIPNKGGDKWLYNLPKRMVDEAQRAILKGIQEEKAYKDVKAKNNIHGPVNALMRPHKNTLDNVKDELKQEMGLYGEVIKNIRFVYTRQEILPLPTFADVYYAEVNSLDGANPPPLKPEDKDEIARAVWLDINDIYFLNDSFYVDFIDANKDKHAVEIPLKHALMLGRAFRSFRDDEIKATSVVGQHSLFNERHNVLAKIQQTLKIPFLNAQQLQIKDILGPTPQLSKENIQAMQQKMKREINADEQDALAHLTKAANAYQKRLLLLVDAFTHSPAKLFDAFQLQNIAAGKNMNLLTNAKAPLFASAPNYLRSAVNDDVKVAIRPRSKSF